MLVKIHQAYRYLVAVCDSDLVGKRFEEGIAVLDVRDNFYRGEEKTEEELMELMPEMVKEDATFSIVGKESVNCALKAGIISEEGVRDVSGIPYALVLL